MGTLGNGLRTHTLSLSLTLTKTHTQTLLPGQAALQPSSWRGGDFRASNYRLSAFENPLSRNTVYYRHSFLHTECPGIIV